MWPRLLDMTREESVESLRNLELQTYSSLVSVLRAQGSLNNDKRRVLKETGILLNISKERHKTEVRKAVNDETLHTIAYHMNGQINSIEDWAIEGRRFVPSLPRIPSESVYVGLADELSELTSLDNNELPPPSDTRRTQASPQISPVSSPVPTHSEECTENSMFRIPEVPREEQPKRKRHHSIGENSTLAQHLLGTKSLSKIQQIYRQSSNTVEPEISETSPSSATENVDKTNIQQPSATTPKINIIENITIPSCKNSLQDRTSFSVFSPNDIHVPVTVYHQNSIVHQPEQFLSSDYQASAMHHKPFIGTCDIQNMPVMLDNELPYSENSFLFNENSIVGENQVVSLLPYSENDTHHDQHNFEPHNNIDVVAEVVAEPEQQTLNAPPQVIIPKQLNKKVIVQNLPTNSILQKTLSVSRNKLTKLNMENFKFLPNSNIKLASKPKMLTLKSNMSKKIIPLSHLQMLQNSKGSLKMVTPSYFSDRTINFNNCNKIIRGNNGVQQQEMNGAVVGNGNNVTKMEIENDVRISSVEELDSNDSMETLSTASNEMEEVNFIEDLTITPDDEINVNDCEFLKTYEEYHNETSEVLEDFEIIQPEEFLN
ncbi:unnamed protein product [Ceutorhynchus assimilis]|uniref:ENT domain-containing protein n=1 Tax=Ceutorhynchus assimilis TaxID=467358 RepID=A0A9N9MJE1_9CUCU|nr:unnamed protein product [Ceutorhynchus assimilis]